MFRLGLVVSRRVSLGKNAPCEKAFLTSSALSVGSLFETATILLFPPASYSELNVFKYPQIIK